MKKIFTLRVLSVVLFMFLFLSKESSAQIIQLPCNLPSVIDSAMNCSGNAPVFGCDCNVYTDYCNASFYNGITKSSTTLSPSCGGTGNCYADFNCQQITGGFYFYDTSIAVGSTFDYIWDFGDGASSNLPVQVQHYYTAAGTYIASLTLIVDAGMASECISTTYRLIQVSTNFYSNYFYTYITSVAPNCTNNGILSAHPYGGVWPYDYNWSNGQTNQTIYGLSPGNYTVTLTDVMGTETVGNFNFYSVCENVIEGYVFNDLNNDCIFDATETPVSNAIIGASNGYYLNYATTDVTGKYSIKTAYTGTYNLFANIMGNTSCPAFVNCSGPVTFNSAGDTATGINIKTGTTTLYDLSLGFTWTGANPGFQTSYTLMPLNQSTVSYSGSAVVVYKYDPNLVYDYSLSPLPVHDAVNHTLTWNLINVPSNYNGLILKNYFTVPVSLPVNYMVKYDFSISPSTNDCDTTNNHTEDSTIVTGSYDPNIKTVMPEGEITNETEYLTYTIHFQNTGNDTTHFVIVKDSLSEYLDPTTVYNLSSSIAYTEFFVSGSGVLTWVFNPMFLPDSASNPLASQGFVAFRIKLKDNLPEGTEINNNARIYFDYNPAIITNTVTNSIVSGVNEIKTASEINIYPNPVTNELTIQLLNGENASNIIITDVLGREVFAENANYPLSIINCQFLSSGVYFIKVQLLNGCDVIRKFVKE